MVLRLCQEDGVKRRVSHSRPSRRACHRCSELEQEPYDASYGEPEGGEAGDDWN
jgi:hypothetical protein